MLVGQCGIQPEIVVVVRFEQFTFFFARRRPTMAVEFHRTTVWFDLETGLLAGLDGHGWPAAGEKEGELLESYH
ncbi:MAG: DUF1571 domain-containing protein, partial [Planctomycetota bacterium]